MRPRLRLGNYEPLVELASGGMATVYVARQIGAAGFERLVVIKRVHRHHLGNREFYRMFLDEARVASLVRHPNVVPVIDTVEQEGELFLVMEYVESTALSTLLKTVAQGRERLPPAIATRIVADTLAGLDAAHEALDMRGNRLEIVHRDVSPQNVVVGVDGTSRLIDFGVAKAAHRLTETKSGSLKGKLAYMSPEQAMGHDVDRRVDLFAAGVMLHEALTGRRLFQGENDLDTMRRITEMPVPDPSSIAPGVPPGLDRVVQRALQRDPNLRFQTASQFIDAIESVIVPAAAREVGAFMLARCGDRIEERRAKLKAIVEGTADPLSMRLVAAVPDGSQDPTVLPPAAARSRSRSGETESQISQVIAGSTRDASLPPPKSPTRGLWIGLGVGGAALALAAVIGGAALWSAQHKTGKSAAAAAAQAKSSAPASNDVTLTVRADGKLAGVFAPGMKRVELAGDHATLVVAPWTGALDVTAILDGGRTARGAVDAAGGRDVKLTTFAPPPPPPPPASTVSATPSTAREGAEKPSRPSHPSAEHAGGRSRSELQENPY